MQACDPFSARPPISSRVTSVQRNSVAWPHSKIVDRDESEAANTGRERAGRVTREPKVASGPLHHNENETQRLNSFFEVHLFATHFRYIAMLTEHLEL